MACEKWPMKNDSGPLTNIWHWSLIHVRELFVILCDYTKSKICLFPSVQVFRERFVFYEL